MKELVAMIFTVVQMLRLPQRAGRVDPRQVVAASQQKSKLSPECHPRQGPLAEEDVSICSGLGLDPLRHELGLSGRLAGAGISLDEEALEHLLLPLSSLRILILLIGFVEVALAPPFIEGLRYC